MPLFKTRDRATTPPPAPVDDHPTRKGSIFHRQSPSTDTSDTTQSSTRSNTGSSLFGRSQADPSIAGAREKVRFAEEREKAADQALVHARQAVADAREHARKLELEAEEE